MSIYIMRWYILPSSPSSLLATEVFIPSFLVVAHVDKRGLNTYPVDHAGLIFDQRRWKIKMDENGEDLRISGCMDKVNQSAKEQKSEI